MGYKNWAECNRGLTLKLIKNYKVKIVQIKSIRTKVEFASNSKGHGKFTLKVILKNLSSPLLNKLKIPELPRW